MSEIVELDRFNFDEKVYQADQPVVVEFVTDWCETCEMLEETVDELADEFDGTIKVARAAIDEEGRLANDHQIGEVPTFVAYFRGNALKRTAGADVTADDVEELFDYLADLPKVAA